MKISVVSLKKSALSEAECSEVRLPTRSGRLTILPQHAPLLSEVVPGLLHVVLANGNEKVWALGGGILRIEDDNILIIADMIEEGMALSADELKDRKEAAKKRLTKMKSGEVQSTMEELLEAENAFFKIGALERLYRHQQK